MKKIGVLFILAIALISSVSAEIIINQQPASTYNLGEVITIPLTIKTLSDIYGTLEMNLICSGQELNFYKNGVYLLAGEQKQFESALVLSKKMIGSLSGSCKIKATLEQDYVLTQDFSISSLITIHAQATNTEVYPKENILIEGYATKQSGKEVDGFVQVDIYYGDINANTTAYLSQLEAINNGYFLLNVTAPSDIKAGAYKVKLRAYEKDLTQVVTNEGYGDASFVVKQLPTSLDVAFESQEVNPGESLKVKAVLHDQTGESIPSTNASITIKDSNGKLRERQDKLTDEFLEFPISNSEPPAEFKVTAESAGLTNEGTFSVKEKANVEIHIENDSLRIINTGNVPYCNRSVLVKIGNQSLNIDVCIQVGKDQKYLLTAPNGEYEVEVLTDNGDSVKGKAILTGKAIDIKDNPSGISGLTRHPFIWFFVVLILGFVAFTIFRKGYKRTIIGKVYNVKKASTTPVLGEGKSLFPLRKDSLIKARNKAELSLSIKGEQQNVSLVCLKIKNLREIESNRGSGEETLQKIVDMAEDMKALTYESQDLLFFIIAPGKTKTFKNEHTAIELAKKIVQNLKAHNAQFKQKIEFGIGLGYGTIVGKQEQDSYKFMSMGTLINGAKKIASVSNEEILLSDKFKEKVPEIRAEKEDRNNIIVYVIKEIKDNKDHEKFIKNFMQRNR
ncbi:hypothetical protein HY212_04630 [Candidatus Pacearchaeota archaeon]|nr:hypothetical protein [Candidatus Pacearchaeota archaeon]